MFDHFGGVLLGLLPMMMVMMIRINCIPYHFLHLLPPPLDLFIHIHSIIQQCQHSLPILRSLMNVLIDHVRVEKLKEISDHHEGESP